MACPKERIYSAFSRRQSVGMVIRVCVLTAVLGLALVAASTAEANREVLRVYWGQNIAFYGDYHTSSFDTSCGPYSESAAESHGYGWLTVALIDTGGTWRYSSRSNQSIVETVIQPNTLASAASWRKKALCKNSGSTTISMNCSYWYWVEDPVRTGCA
jgi:hypothetical protein